MRKMYSENQIKDIVNKGIEDGSIHADPSTEVKVGDINSESATAGKVIVANGEGGASWGDIPNELPIVYEATENTTIRELLDIFNVPVGESKTFLNVAIKYSSTVPYPSTVTLNYYKLVFTYTGGYSITGFDFSWVSGATALTILTTALSVSSSDLDTTKVPSILQYQKHLTFDS